MRRTDNEIRARIEELRKLEATCISSYMITHIVQHLLLIPSYQAGRAELEWALGSNEVVKGGPG